MKIASLTIVTHVPEYPSSAQPRPSSDPPFPSALLHHEKPVLALAMAFKEL